MVQIQITVFGIILLISVDLLFAAPTLKPHEVTKIISYKFEPNGLDGNYYFMYKSSDGSFREEKGEMMNENLVVKGVYGYLSPDNKHITVVYQADEDGYRVISPPPKPNDDLPNRFKPHQEPLDDALICSLLGRCAVEGNTGNVNPEASV